MRESEIVRLSLGKRNLKKIRNRQHVLKIHKITKLQKNVGLPRLIVAT